MTIYPWQQTQWQHLMTRSQAARLPHALLLTGPHGMGKYAFASALSQRLLCEAPQDDDRPCTQCRQCELFAAGTHPDYMEVTPAEAGKPITVDQVRELGHYVNLSSQAGGYKLAVISPAETMNTAAANCLLKSLEEPPGGVVLILVTAQPARLPATIRSRCQQLTFHVPEHQVAARWLVEQGVEAAQPELYLALSQGAPLAALALAQATEGVDRRELLRDFQRLTQGEEDPVGLAEKWLKLDFKQSLYCLYTWVVDMIRLKASPAPPVLANFDAKTELSNMAKTKNISWLYKTLDSLHEAYRLQDTQVNKQLMLEDLLLPWQPVADRVSAGNRAG